jgi:hypothetical protein
MVLFGQAFNDVVAREPETPTVVVEEYGEE